MIQTLSTCPICAKTIPATVEIVNGAVLMRKSCSEHGSSEATLERDPRLWVSLRQSRAPIYDAHFIDVTERCNLKCPYCYYPCGNRPDPPLEQLVQEALTVDVPALFTGGEPTLRADLPELMSRVQNHRGSSMPTNGVGLLDKSYLAEVLKYIGRYGDGNFAKISLSWHEDLNAPTYWKVVENIRAAGARISGSLNVMSSLDQLPEILERAEKTRDCFDYARIHIDTDVWQGTGGDQIFFSDILEWMKGRPFEWYPSLSNSVWICARYNGIKLAFAKWPTRHDIDLPALPRYPSYTARNGEIVHVIHGFIINEAMQRGWCKGRRMQPVTHAKIKKAMIAVLTTDRDVAFINRVHAGIQEIQKLVPSVARVYLRERDREARAEWLKREVVVLESPDYEQAGNGEVPNVGAVAWQRNSARLNALQNGCDALWFIDSDVVVDRAAVVEMLAYSQTADVVVAPYRIRQTGRFSLGRIEGGGIQEIVHNGAADVDIVPAGCTLIRGAALTVPFDYGTLESRISEDIGFCVELKKRFPSSRVRATAATSEHLCEFPKQETPCTGLECISAAT